MSGDRLKLSRILILTLIISLLLIQEARGTSGGISSLPTPAIPLTSYYSYANLIENPNVISPSYYMTRVQTTDSYNLGINLGVQLLSMNGAQNEVVILDYGRPRFINSNYGTDLNIGSFAGINDIAASVTQFAQGFYNADIDKTDILTIVVGTNNKPYVEVIPYDHGHNWADMVHGLEVYAHSVLSDQVYILGGSDMEPTYSNVYTTERWVQGYNYNQYLLYNFGSADGCPLVRNNQSMGCNNGWSQEDVYRISSNNFYAGIQYNVQPLPEIYLVAEVNGQSEVNAKQWYSLSGYAYSAHNGIKLNIVGSLTQYGACIQVRTCDQPGTYNNPLIGAQQLYKWLNSSPDTAQVIIYSTDISWYP
jgi:hypothetical protein